jgi:hypothetical protein
MLQRRDLRIHPESTKLGSCLRTALAALSSDPFQGDSEGKAILLLAVAQLAVWLRRVHLNSNHADRL